MPTPVSAARQCLTSDASQALDEAVAVAKRRNHLQTTSLHTISAFLSLPSSFLREACARVRSSAYSPRLQFKALELCFGVALDRLTSSSSSSSSSQTTPDEPPISNSLMAAIKRSQANQRRNPESFQIYQQQLQQQQQQSSVSCVKVELQQFILSILDDPVVSKVFAEAGFQSTEIKLAILRPPPPLVRFQRSRCPPLFLCNLPGGDSDSGFRSFSFPFSGFSGVSNTVSDGDENCRRIGEVLVRKKERNPLLVGVCANDAVKSFEEIVERGRSDVFPLEISGLNFSSIEKEVFEYINGSRTEDLLSLRFEELERLIKSCAGPGVMVSFGDLKGFIDGTSVEAGSFVVTQLKRLLDVHSGKLWLMGTATSYETYLKFLTRFPSIEKDLDLQLLPITSSKPSIGGFYSRPQSLMESFVPFGGFFSTPSDLKGPLPSRNQSVSRCHQCNEKYEQEVCAILKGGSTLSVADQYQENLPSWLQTAELSPNKGLDASKVKDDGAVLNAKVTGLQKKWNDICRRLNHSSPMAEPDNCQVGPQVFPRFVGFPFVTDRKDKTDNGNSSSSGSTHASPTKSSNENAFPSVSMGLEKLSAPNQDMPTQLACDGKDENFVANSQVKLSSESLQTMGLDSPICPPSNSSNPSCHESSATSVTTDLGLGTLYGSSYKEPKNPLFQAHKVRLQDISGCSPSQVDVVCPSVSYSSVRSSYCSDPRLSGQFDPTDLKSLWRSLTEKVGRQNEVIHAISETIARCRTGNERRHGAILRRDIWFSFAGPDRVAKRRVAVALAEVMFGSRQNLICVDLSSQDGITRSSTIFDSQEINGHDIKFRGKTVVDYIAGEISKKPLSVIFLENVDKADLLVQSSLTQAIRTGKFSDLHGREVGINNAIFVTTSGVMKDSKTISSAKEQVNFSEERILGVQGWEMKILIGSASEDTTLCSSTSNVSVTSKTFVNKRKLIGRDGSTEHLEFMEMTKRACKKSSKCLDLNLPVQEEIEEENDPDSVNDETSNSISDNTESWLEDFFDQVDKTVVFKPFDFDALAQKILKEFNERFRNTFEFEGLLEIDIKVMEQILAAAWLSDNKTAVEDWVEQVVGRSFAEVRQKYGLRSGSTMKLVTCEGILMQERAPGVCLPAKIILN